MAELLKTEIRRPAVVDYEPFKLREDTDLVRKRFEDGNTVFMYKKFLGYSYKKYTGIDERVWGNEIIGIL